MQCPHLRKELIDNLRCLSSREYQMSVWVNHKYPTGIEYDGLDVVINFLFDDTCLADDIEEAIGFYIYENEVCCIKRVIFLLDELFSKYGTKEKDSFYINLPEWDFVLTAANDAYNQLQANDPGKK